MLPDYADITSRISEPALWYDSHGVPRYDEFSPDMLGVYDDFAVLAEVACQGCGGLFVVGVGHPRYDLLSIAGGAGVHEYTLEELTDRFSYGDAPRHSVDGTRCGGETMTSVTVRVLQAWEAQTSTSWIRQNSLETS
jgi:hypothetical protein